MVKKMVDFGNHRRFTLRCLEVGITPVSLRLKNNIRILRSLEIIRRAERELLNVKMRCINNTINISAI